MEDVVMEDVVMEDVMEEGEAVEVEEAVEEVEEVDGLVAEETRGFQEAIVDRSSFQLQRRKYRY